MTEEMATVLSDVGVRSELVYEEPYFNRRHHPAPEVLDGIRRRFRADDLLSAHADRNGSPFGVEVPLNRRPAAQAR